MLTCVCLIHTLRLATSKYEYSFLGRTHTSKTFVLKIWFKIGRLSKDAKNICRWQLVVNEPSYHGGYKANIRYFSSCMLEKSTCQHCKTIFRSKLVVGWFQSKIMKRFFIKAPPWTSLSLPFKFNQLSKEERNNHTHTHTLSFS